MISLHDVREMNAYRDGRFCLYNYIRETLDEFG
jgi:hypothetical protein